MMKSRLLGAVGIVTVVGAGVLAAQAPASPAFEVASVKPNPTRTLGNRIGVLGMSMRIPNSRALEIRNAPLRRMVQRAYEVQILQVVGGPAWTDSDTFDITAKTDSAAGAGEVDPHQIWQMLAHLLEDRFSLRVHHETRELSIYALVRARRDGTLGSHIHPSTLECDPVLAARERSSITTPQPPPTVIGPPGKETLGPYCGLAFENASPGGVTLRPGGVTMSDFAGYLQAEVDRMVVDQTGLAGRFDLDVTFKSDRLPLPPGGSQPVVDAPALFTALEEELGLKLESTTGPVDVLVIDHVEHPTAD